MLLFEDTFSVSRKYKSDVLSHSKLSHFKLEWLIAREL